MSATVRPFCCGRVARGHVVAVSALPDGRHVALVIELATMAVVTEAITETAPARADLQCLLEGFQ